MMRVATGILCDCEQSCQGSLSIDCDDQSSSIGGLGRKFCVAHRSVQSTRNAVDEGEYYVKDVFHCWRFSSSVPTIGPDGVGFEGSAYMIDARIVNIASGTFAMGSVNSVETIDGLVETSDIRGGIAGDGGAG